MNPDPECRHILILFFLFGLKKSGVFLHKVIFKSITSILDLLLEGFIFDLCAKNILSTFFFRILSFRFTFVILLRYEK